jgi:formate dehydrogenase major subunit
MTNHWSDIANSTFVLVWGANPAENHPACIAHINRARFPKQYFLASDARAAKTGAKMVVVDPRQTRTALMVDPTHGDRYIRIRPGTDIALQNAVLSYIIGQMESPTSTVASAAKTAFYAFLNQTAAGTFYSDGSSATTAVTDESLVLTGVVASFLVNAGLKGTVTVKSQDGLTTYAATDYTVDLVNGSVVRTPASTIPTGATVLVSYSWGASALMTNVAGNSKYTDARFLVNALGTDYQRATLNPGTGRQISNFPVKASSVTADPNTVYNRLKSHVAPYTAVVAADICGCQVDDVAFLGDAIIENSRCSSGVSADPRDPAYRATTILYAMGQTQHTYGAQNIKGFANLQSLMGNMGRAGGGINALRGIHNVQGSTDMGLLFANIPGYSNNPTLQADGGPDWRITPNTNNAFGDYMNGLWGNPLSGTGSRATMNDSFDDAYNTTATALGAMALQQRGFFNMTLKWFGDYTSIIAMAGAARRAAVDACYSLWPKGNGDDHVSMFRAMAAGTTKALMCWGQNPAVTEPNQGAIRTGLYNLDLLVCVDMFENETAGISRKPTGVTFLIPTAAHVEKAGSATNSGRTLQWRYQAAVPAGNCKDDTELLLRFAKALDDAGNFSHIKAVWDANGITYDASVFKQLYGNPYGGYMPGTNSYAAISGTAEMVNVRHNVTDPVTYNTTTVTGSEWASETVYREMNSPSAVGGTMWIYTGAYNSTATWTTDNKGSAQAVWAVQNRAKSRDNTDDLGQMQYHGWGYAWLVNRRVFYNNSEVLSDVADFYMEPDSCSHLFATNNAALLNYSRWYRHNHTLKDLPSPVLAANTSSPHYAGNTVSLAGRFPGHTEPYETPRQDLLTPWGRNTKGTAGNYWDLVKNDTRVAGRGFVNGVGGKTVTDPPAASFPLILTTIRCVEHFQGGPITRNNWYNVELEPEPWIELNSSDARTYGIKDGDYVRIVTARTVDDSGATVIPASPGAGFKARVGSGLSTSQKVGPGLVAIPWHWGEKGLSTGSRANDLCIDAADANSVIPEYKACLCRLEKI